MVNLLVVIQVVVVVFLPTKPTLMQRPLNVKHEPPLFYKALEFMA